MAIYRYTARDADGRTVTGQVEADSAESASALLDDRELDVIELSPVDELAAGRELNAVQAEELVAQVADVAQAEVPLAPALRAAAEECSSARVSAALDWIAGQLDRGKSLERTLEQADNMLPPHVRGLVSAAVKGGGLGDTLMRLVEQQKAARNLQRWVLSGFIYPGSVVVLAIAVLSTILAITSSSFETMMEEFGLKLPAVTEALFWWCHHGLWVLSSLLTVFVAFVVISRVLLGRVVTSKLRATMPLFGRLWYWSAIAEWCSLMHLLLSSQMRLDEALRLAADGVRDAYVAMMSTQLGRAVSQGGRLSSEAARNDAVPATLLPLLEWGEKSNRLENSFETAADMFRRRTWSRAVLLRQIVPPVLFVGVASVVIIVVLALFMPLIGLISQLS